MNTELFHAAIEAALAAYDLKQNQDFAAAIRVAQSAIAEYPRSCRLLDQAQQQFPSLEVPQMLRSIAAQFSQSAEKLMLKTA